MNAISKAPRHDVLLSNAEALREILLAALTLSTQMREMDVAEHILDGLRALCEPDDASDEPIEDDVDAGAC